ncbi:radical SAM protein, partial [bacterium]|nr:radical SAM protein [bacterium]
MAQLDGNAVLAADRDASIHLPPKHKRGDPAWRDRRLMVAAALGRWLIADAEHVHLFRFLSQPRSWDAVREKFGDRAAHLGTDLWQRGLITVNGRRNVGRVRAKEPRQPSFIALHMAQGCNFRCAYCYNEASGQSRLSSADALKLLEKAGRELSCSEISVDFLGGEPLLAWPEIVQVMRGARLLEKQLGKKFNFMMQTNGSLLTPDKVRILIEYRVGVGVSLDGPESVHDLRRRTVSGAPTHAAVVKNMLEARRLGLDVNPLAVVCDYGNCAESLEYFVRELGVRTVRFNSFSRLGRARSSEEACDSSPAYQAQGFLAMADKALQLAAELEARLRVYDLCWYLHDLVSDERPYMCRRSPCGLGEAIVSYGADGFLYACEEYEENTRAAMCLGRPEEVDLGKLRETSPFWKRLKPRTIESIPKCARCVWRHFCGGGCAHKAFAAYGTWYREDPMCGFYERIFPELMWRIGEDSRYLKYL